MKRNKKKKEIFFISFITLTKESLENLTRCWLGYGGGRNMVFLDPPPKKKIFYCIFKQTFINDMARGLQKKCGFFYNPLYYEFVRKRIEKLLTL